MSLKIWHIPLRLATGVFILNSGLSKRGAQGQHAEELHGFAASAYPQVEDVKPERFAENLSKAEIALGALLLVPLVPSWLAGAGLTAFAVGLNGLYWRAPGLRQEGDVRPTEAGIGIAKDAWMTAIGTSLVLGELSSRRAAAAAPRRRVKRSKGRARRRA